MLSEKDSGGEGRGIQRDQTMWFCNMFHRLAFLFSCFEQGGTDTDDVINTCSKTSDGHVVLTGGTEADWAGTGATPGFVSTVVIKLDVTDGTVLWQHQVLPKSSGILVVSLLLLLLL